ncbi:Hexose_transporter [Hexamita inflata]|uniref:Hexose transporter n=1 Tax=Hexamita inflata TaxID=28002 RepID=A0AA86TZA1_9EUKA|nr:Hexose transporter [Hexamita inflata]
MSVLTENRWLLKFRLAIIVEFSMWNILFSKLFVLSVFALCIKIWQQFIGIWLNIALDLKKIMNYLILWCIKKTQNVFLRLNQECFQQYNYKWYQNQHKCSYTYNNQYLHICKIQQRQSISKRCTTWKTNQFYIFILKAFYSKSKSIFLVRHSSTFGVKSYKQKQNQYTSRPRSHNCSLAPSRSVSLKIEGLIQYLILLTRSQFIRIVYVTVSLGMMQMFSGVDAIIVYASEIFGSLFSSSRAGIYGSLILGTFNVFYSYVAAPFAEKQPRRRMLMIGVLGVSFFHFLNAFLYQIHAPTIYVLISLLLLFLFYILGPEPIVFMFFSEMFPQKYKIQLNGLRYTVNWISSIVSVFMFDFFVGGREQYVYVIFGTLTFTLGVSGTLLAPETFHKSLAEIELQIRSWTRKQRRSKEKKNVKVNMNDFKVEGKV